MNLNSLIKMIGSTMVRSLVYRIGRRGSWTVAVLMAVIGAVLYVVTGTRHG